MHDPSIYELLTIAMAAELKRIETQIGAKKTNDIYKKKPSWRGRRREKPIPR